MIYLSGEYAWSQWTQLPIHSISKCPPLLFLFYSLIKEKPLQRIGLSLYFQSLFKFLYCMWQTCILNVFEVELHLCARSAYYIVVTSMLCNSINVGESNFWRLCMWYFRAKDIFYNHVK